MCDSRSSDRREGALYSRRSRTEQDFLFCYENRTSILGVLRHPLDLEILSQKFLQPLEPKTGIADLDLQQQLGGG